MCIRDRNKEAKKSLEKKLKVNSDILKENLNDQKKFNQIISKIISDMKIENNDFDKDAAQYEESAPSLNEPQKHKSKEQEFKQEKGGEELSIDVDLPDSQNPKDEKISDEEGEEIEEFSETGKRKSRKIFGKGTRKYKVYTKEFDEVTNAENLESEEELLRLSLIHI